MNGEGQNPRDKFADIELTEEMKKLGFELSHHEGIADWFVKDEGTSELTVFGAREMLKLMKSHTQQIALEARIDENKRWQKLLLDREALHSLTKVNVLDYEQRITALKQAQEKDGE